MEKFNLTQFYSGFLAGALRVAALTVLLLLCHAGHSSAFAQSSGRTIDLELNDVSVLDALREINRLGGDQVMFRNEEVEKETAHVTVSMRNATVAQAVEAVLRGTGFTHSMRGETVVVSARRQTPGQSANFYRGYVRSADGAPLIGASVVIEGTTIGASTDAKGYFELRSSSEEVVLSVSYLGYKSVSRTVRANTETVIYMDPEDMAIERVVVTGYQTIHQQRMTGSTSTITASDIANKGFTNVEQALNGTVSGVNLVMSGRPGQDSKIQIRGVNSLTGSTDPIWIVDGMPMQGDLPDIKMAATELQTSVFTTGIGNIAPDDIKSITVLKDAAATAIYGARAANGVIVIETKSGMSGRTQFTASVNFGVTERPRNNVDMMNTAQKIQFEREIIHDQAGLVMYPGRVTSLLNKAGYGLITSAEAERQIAELAGTNTDWFKEIFRTGFQQQYNFSMSGGTEKTQYYTSLNYLTEKGTMPNNHYDRLGMNIKLTHSPTSKIHITGGLTATLRNDKATASVIDPLEYAMFANPYEKPYNADGSYAYDQSWDPEQSAISPGLKWDKLNAIHDFENNTGSNRYLDAALSLKVEWEIVKGLMFTSHGMYNANSNHDRVSEGAGTYTNYINNWYRYRGELPHEMVRGSLREGTSYSDGYTWRNTLQYSFESNDKHYFTFFAGQEISSRTSYTSFNFSPVFDSEHRIIGFPEMDGVDGSQINYLALGNTGKTVYKLSSFFANASYSYMDRYILTGAMRYDGSDIIGNDNQFTPLWNIGARWNLHNEGFMQNVRPVDLLSLRAGFGYTGSIDKNALPFMTMTLAQSVVYDGQNVPSGFTYPNPNIKWQTKQDLNIGFDLSMFNYRMELSVNYYYNITQDVLDTKGLAWSSGRNSIVRNIADIYNNGVEIDLGATLVRNDNFRWFAKFNIAFNSNEVRNTYYKSTAELPRPTMSNTNPFVEGYPVGGWFGYKFVGVNELTGAVLIASGNGDGTYDMNETGVERLDPKIYYLGKSIPPVTGGFSTSVSWKQLLLSANFEFKTGHKIKSFSTYRELDSKNRHVNDIKRWRQPGDVSNIPMMLEGYNSYSQYMYDNRLESGDYLRCSHVSLGYNFSPKLISRIGFGTARLNFTAYNLFTLTKYSGIDPSLMGAFGYPNSRRYTISLNVGF